MKNILLIEDDENISFGIKIYLEKRDFRVTVGDCIKRGVKLFKTNHDLIILDMNLPDGTGYDFLKFVRSKSNTAIIFLTVIDEDSEIVKGLNLGADDYITKPFSLSILESRINNILRRIKRDISLDDEIMLSGLRLIKSQTKVFKGDIEVFLTGREYRLLEMFMENINQTLTREFILERLWDIESDFVNDNTLTVTIKRLREKIEDNPNKPKILRTIRGIGYRMENDNE